MRQWTRDYYQRLILETPINPQGDYERMTAHWSKIADMTLVEQEWTP